MSTDALPPDAAGAQAELAEIHRAGPEHPFWNGADPGHAAEVERVTKLYELSETAAAPTAPPFSATPPTLAPPPPAGMTPAAARAEISRLLTDRSGPLHNQASPFHAEAVQRLADLYRIAEPDDEAPPPASAAATAPAVELPELPGGARWDATEVNAAVEMAETFGMDRAEAGRWAKYLADAYTREPPDPEQSLETLKAEWRDEFPAKLAAARHATARMPESFRIMLDRTGLGDDVALIKRMASLGQGLHGVQQKIRRILEDRQHPANVRTHPDHARAVADLNGLYRQLYGDD